MRRIFAIFSVVFVMSSNTSAKDKNSAPLLSFKNGTTYSIQETSKMPGQVMRNLWKYNVIKVYPDGSALIEASVEKMESGKTASSLSQRTDPAMKGMKQYYLYTKDALIFIVGGGIPGSGDDIDELRKAPDTKKWLKSSPGSPMDWYKLPMKKLAVNSSVKKNLPGDTQKWKITRLKDENIAGKKAEVYQAKESTGTITEIYWYDPAERNVIKRKIIQGSDVEIEQVRI